MMFGKTIQDRLARMALVVAGSIGAIAAINLAFTTHERNASLNKDPRSAEAWGEMNEKHPGFFESGSLGSNFVPFRNFWKEYQNKMVGISDKIAFMEEKGYDKADCLILQDMLISLKGHLDFFRRKYGLDMDLFTAEITILLKKWAKLVKQAK